MHAEKFVDPLVLFFKVVVLFKELVREVVLSVPVRTAHSINENFQDVQMVFVNFFDSLPEVWVFQKKISDENVFFNLSVTKIEEELAVPLLKFLFLSLF